MAMCMTATAADHVIQIELAADDWTTETHYLLPIDEFDPTQPMTSYTATATKAITPTTWAAGDTVRLEFNYSDAMGIGAAAGKHFTCQVNFEGSSSGGMFASAPLNSFTLDGTIGHTNESAYFYGNAPAGSLTFAQVRFNDDSISLGDSLNQFVFEFQVPSDFDGGWSGNPVTTVDSFSSAVVHMFI